MCTVRLLCVSLSERHWDKPCGAELQPITAHSTVKYTLVENMHTHEHYCTFSIIVSFNKCSPAQFFFPVNIPTSLWGKSSERIEGWSSLHPFRKQNGT